MSDIVWAMIVGPLMWIPGLNIIVGALAGGWAGALVGLLVTMLASGAGSQSETVKNAASAAKGWWDVLGVRPDASRDEVMQAYRRKAKAAHPDAGGSAAKMAEVNAAKDAALREVH
jgi:hypothetical protein